MLILTALRAVAWFGVFIVFWSLNVRWGTDVRVDVGPPAQWQRAVVGCGLLAFIGALALSVSGRKGNPPSWKARGVALGAGVLIGVIALVLRSKALASFPDHIAGAGWTWMLAGGGFVLSAAIMSLSLKPAESNKAHKEAGEAGAGDKHQAASQPGGGKTASMQKGAGKGKKKKRRKR
jgi:hypothetical protein